MSFGLVEARELVAQLFGHGRSPHGELTRLDNGTEAFPNVLFRFTMENDRQERWMLQLYKDVGSVGGELWDQEMRALRNLSAIQHPALPTLIGGRREGEEAAWVLTDAARYNLALEGAMGYMAQNPRDALRQLLLLSDALGQLHGRGMWHRNLWPASVEVAVEPDRESGQAIALRLARFEMSAMLENLLRRVDRPLDDRLLDLRSLYLLADDARACNFGACRGLVARAVVNDDHLAPGRRACAGCETTSPIASASFMAGMTIETDDASAKELLHDSVPGDRSCAGQSGTSQPCGELPIGGETRHGEPEGLGFRGAHESVLAVHDELERAA